MERFFVEHQTELVDTLEMTSNETIKQAVMAGMGLSFISEHTIGLEVAAGRLVRLSVEGTPVVRHWHLVHRTEKRLLPAAVAFKEFMSANGERLIAAQEKLPTAFGERAMASST